MPKGADESLHFPFVFPSKIEKEFSGIQECFLLLYFLPDLHGVVVEVDLHDHVLSFELRRQRNVSVESLDLTPAIGFPDNAQQIHIRLLQMPNLSCVDVARINGRFALGKKSRIGQKVGIVRMIKFGKFPIDFFDGRELECLPYLPVEDRIAAFHRSIVPRTVGCVEQRDGSIGAQPFDHFPDASFSLDESPKCRSIIHLQKIRKRQIQRVEEQEEGIEYCLGCLRGNTEEDVPLPRTDIFATQKVQRFGRAFEVTRSDEIHLEKDLPQSFQECFRVDHVHRSAFLFAVVRAGKIVRLHGSFDEIE